MHDMPNREGNRKDQPQQPERHQQERRQQEQKRNEERRQQQPRNDAQMAGGRNEEMTPDSLPSKETNSGRQSSSNWAGDNSQSGTSQAQKGEGNTPKEHERKGEGRGSHPSQGNPSQGSRSNPSEGNQSNPSKGKEAGSPDKGFDRGPEKKQEPGDRKDFGDNRDTGFGRQEDADRGSGGKVDPSQRDMGQTGRRK